MSKLTIGLAVLLVIGGSAAFWMTSRSSAEASITSVPVVAEGEVVDVGNMTLNVGGPESHVARVGLALVLATDADSGFVKERLALVRDAAVSIVAASDADTLATVEGIDVLRRSLTDKAVELFGADTVMRVVLTELLVQ